MPSRPKPKYHSNKQEAWTNLRRSLNVLASVRHPLTAYQFARRMDYNGSMNWPAARVGASRLAVLVSQGYVNCKVTRKRGLMYPERHYTLSDLGIHRLFYMDALDAKYHHTWPCIAIDELNTPAIRIKNETH